MDSSRSKGAVAPFAVDFDGTPFLETSRVGAFASRLAWRAEVLLARNQSLVEGKRILDIASHDGRFSYACLQLGARHVTGIEGRAGHVANAERNLKELGIDANRWSFVQGDLFDFLARSEPGQFDTILCFGVFYHILRHVDLLGAIKRLAPAHFILDTRVAPEQSGRVDMHPSVAAVRKLGRRTVDALRGRRPNVGCLVFQYEDPKGAGTTIDARGLVAVPTPALVETLLRHSELRSTRIAWSEQGVTDWSTLRDYRRGNRASWLAEP